MTMMRDVIPSWTNQMISYHGYLVYKAFPEILGDIDSESCPQSSHTCLHYDMDSSDTH